MGTKINTQGVPRPDPVVSSGWRQQVRAPHREAGHPCVTAFENEFDYLTRTLRRLGVSSNDIEDLAHEVFLVLYQQWEKYDPERPIRAYLFGIAFRVASNHRRKYRKEVAFAVIDTDDNAPGPEGNLESRRARLLVLAALQKVPLARRSVLILHDIDELPMNDIAETLSIPQFTGYSRLRKARKEFAAAVRAFQTGAM